MRTGLLAIRNVSPTSRAGLGQIPRRIASTIGALKTAVETAWQIVNLGGNRERKRETRATEEGETLYGGKKNISRARGTGPGKTMADDNSRGPLRTPPVKIQSD